MFFSCLDALAACNYLPQSREKIIAALFKALNSTNNELQEAGEACMRKASITSLILAYCRCYWMFVCEDISKFFDHYENPRQKCGLVFTSCPLNSFSAVSLLGSAVFLLNFLAVNLFDPTLILNVFRVYSFNLIHFLNKIPQKYAFFTVTFQ